MLSNEADNLLKTSQKKTRKNKFLKNNKSLFVFILLFVLSTSILVTLGLFAPPPDYDIVLVSTKRTSLNYIRGSGDTQRAIDASMEGFLISRSGKTQELSEDKSKWEPAAEESRKLLQKYSSSYKPKLLTNANMDVQSNFSLSSALRTWGGTQGTHAKNKIQKDDPGFMLSATAKDAFVSEDFLKWRFYIGEQNTWTTGNKITPIDFIAGAVMSMDINTGAAMAYMYVEKSHIKNLREGYASQKKGSAHYGKPILENPVFTKSFGDIDTLDNSGKIKDIGGNWINKNEAGILYSQNHMFIQYNLEFGFEEFNTMLNSQNFYPIDWQWYKKNINLVSNFGTSVDQISTNGPFKPIMIDSSFGYGMERRENHPWRKAIPTKKLLIRYISQPSMAVTLFKSGAISFIEDSDSTADILRTDPSTKKFIKPMFSMPRTRLAFFNLSEHNKEGTGGKENGTAKFYKNVNFRRAINYAVDRKDFHRVSGQRGLYPEKTLTPMKLSFFKDENTSKSRDAVDYFNEYEFNPMKNKTQKISFQTKKQRLDSIKDLDKNEKYRDDENYDKVIADYYWSKFLLDMKSLSINVPTTIEAEFLTPYGDSDPTYVAVNTSLRKTLKNPDGSPKFILTPVTKQGGSFWESFRAGNFDFMAINWNPDYAHAFAAQTLFNATDDLKQTNFLSTSTYWNSQEAISGATYNDVQNETIKKTFPKVGLFELQRLANETTKSSRWESIFPKATLQNPNFKGMETFIKKFAKVKKGDTPPTGKFPIWYSEGVKEIDGKTAKVEIWQGINEKTIFAMTQNEQQLFTTLLEIINIDSALALPLANEIIDISPSRLINYTTTDRIGFQSKYFAYDFRRKPDGWPGEDVI